MENQVYDVIIAGGGFAGVLAAVRICEQKPEYKVLIVEKDEEIGGRLKSTGVIKNRWSCGLNRITQDMYEFANATFNGTCDEYDLSQYIKNENNRIGVLSGGKITEFFDHEFFTVEGAKAIGGLAAKREWVKIDELIQSAKEDETIMDAQFSKVWKFIRKNPAAIVMEHFANSIGITDIWASSVRALIERSDEIKKGMYSGEWETAFLKVLTQEKFAGRIEVKTNSQIVESEYRDKKWYIRSGQGEFVSHKLVVTQPPWSTLEWLSKDLWQANLLEMALKSRPTSVVVLASKISQYQDMPELTLIPSEKVNVTTLREKEMTFQTIIDYEVSLDAPEVVKAVKRLKRAKKKIIKFVEGVELQGERLELLPTAWGQSFHNSDRRLLVKLDKKSFNTDYLFFCGDSYGPHYSGDENLKQSLIQVCEHI